jgi:hypothetical protein
MSKQTAVEFLAKSLKDFPHIKHSQSFKDLVNQAKAMEKEQIEDAWNSAYGGDANHTGEQYFNETYGGDK